MLTGPPTPSLTTLGLNIIAINYHCRVLIHEIISNVGINYFLAFLGHLHKLINRYFASKSSSPCMFTIIFIRRTLFVHWSLVIVTITLQFYKNICDNIKSDRDINEWIFNLGDQFQDNQGLILTSVISSRVDCTTTWDLPTKVLHQWCSRWKRLQLCTKVCAQMSKDCSCQVKHKSLSFAHVTNCATSHRRGSTASSF
jgi:hypothetical protein